MSRAARSLFVFGIYLEALAIVLIVWPNRLLHLFGVAQTHEVWIRALGVLVLNIGVYYLVAAHHDFRSIIVASVPIRFGVMGFFVAFVLMNFAEAPVLIFGAADVVGAVWTFRALRADARAGV